MACKRFAITGGIACGKSTVAAILPALGGAVLDTDDVTHALEAPGGDAVRPIVEAFGTRVLAADRSIDRRELGRIVFSDPVALSRLDSIVHPLVIREVGEWLEERADVRFKAVVIPLLFECGFETAFEWDSVIAVVCHAEEQLRRLRGRGLSEEGARARISSQFSCAEKARRSDRVIWNDSDRTTLRHEVEKAVQALLV